MVWRYKWPTMVAGQIPLTGQSGELGSKRKEGERVDVTVVTLYMSPPALYAQNRQESLCFDRNAIKERCCRSIDQQNVHFVPASFAERT